VLYTMLNEDAALAAAVVRAIVDTCPEPRLYWPAPVNGRALPEAARAAGVEVISEVNFDLDYDRDGNLVLQREKKGVDLEKLRRDVNGFLCTGEVTATTGERIKIEAQSISVHGDGPNALEVTNTIRETLATSGWQVAPA
jgi:5-oxoprolinase (ATP-hydrolysing) subunit A